MIALRDSTEVSATPRQVFTWLEQMPKAYTAWHPDHVACRVLRGSLLEVGSEIECEEYLHGKLHSLRFRTTKVVPENRVEFAIAGLGCGAFAVEENGDGVRFVAELQVGSDAPIIGPLVDFILRAFFGRRLEALRRHMAEEGCNLKRLLESQAGLPPGSATA